MKPFHFNTDNLQQVATACVTKDLYSTHPIKKTQVRLFTQGIRYKVTRLYSHMDGFIAIDNNKEEHQIGSDWFQYFTLMDNNNKPMTTTKTNTLTPYDIKERKKAIDTLAKLIRDEEEKKKNLEANLIAMANEGHTEEPNSQHYLINVSYSIRDCVKLIAYWKDQIGTYSLQLVNAEISC